MDYKGLLEFQKNLESFSTEGLKFAKEKPEGLSPEQSKEYDRIMKYTDLGKSISMNLSDLDKRKKELEILTKGFNEMYTK